MMKPKWYAWVTVGAILVSIVSVKIFTWCLASYDHFTYRYTVGDEAYYRAVFTDWRILLCFLAVLAASVVAAVFDIRSIHEKQRGSVLLLILLGLDLAVYTALTYFVITGL